MPVLLFATRASKPNSPKTYKGSPYQDARFHGGAQKVPGRVECSYYDRGGEGVAYHDADAKNNGSGALNPADGTYLNQFRMEEGVDISYTKFHDQIDNSPYDLVLPPENQLYVGWTEPGEWFNLTVQVAHAGLYTTDLLYTSNRGGTISNRRKRKRCYRPINTSLHVQCLRSHRLAAMASLEHRSSAYETETTRRQKRSNRIHFDRRKYESRILRIQSQSIANQCHEQNRIPSW